MIDMFLNISKKGETTIMFKYVRLIGWLFGSCLVAQISHATPQSQYNYFVKIQAHGLGKHIEVGDIIIEKTVLYPQKRIVQYQSLLDKPIENPFKYSQNNKRFVLTENNLVRQRSPSFDGKKTTFFLDSSIIKSNDLEEVSTDTWDKNFLIKTTYVKEMMAGKKVYDYAFLNNNKSLREQIDSLPEKYTTFGEGSMCLRPHFEETSKPYITFAESPETSIGNITLDSFDDVMAHQSDTDINAFFNGVDKEGRWQGVRWFTVKHSSDYLSELTTEGFVLNKTGLHKATYFAQGKQQLKNTFCKLTKEQAAFIGQAYMMIVKQKKQ